VKKLWPEFLVLGLFLLGDVVWDGLISAAAGAGAGIFAYLILLFFKIKKPGLIVEGLLFGGITALGEFVDFPGGSIILMELVFGIILLSTAFFGKNIIHKMAGGLTRGLFSESQSRLLSIVLGSLLLAHSLLCTVLAVLGFLNWLVGGILFLAMYLLALRISKASMKNAVLNSLPVLVQEEDNIYRLEAGGVISGRIRLKDETGTMVTTELMLVESKPHEFLKQLEIALGRRGIRSYIIESWSWDEIELEMQGFRNINGKWIRKLH